MRLVKSLLLVLLLSSTAAYAEKIKIGWVFAMANAPAVIAKEKGYFKEQGLDVDIRSFTSGPLVHKALSAGQLDMAYIGTPPVYHWYSKGLKSQIIAKVNYGQAAIITRNDSGIKDVKSLKNRKLAGVRKGSGMDVLLRGYVLGEAAELDPKSQVRIVPMPPGNMGASVESKIVDAAFIWEPFTSQYLARGNTKLIFNMNEAVPQYPWYVVMAMPNTLKKKKAAVVKVLKAHKKAIEFLNSSPTAGNDIIAKTFKLKSVKGADGKTIKPEEIVAMARKRLGWDWRLTDKDKEFVQRLMNYSLKLGFIKKPLKADDLVDKSFLAQIQ